MKDFESEQARVDRHSTPGLKKNTLDRAAKKDQLNALRMPVDDRDDILRNLFGEEPK